MNLHPLSLMTRKRNLWFDHGAGYGGDNIELLVRLKGWDFKEAVEYLKNICGHTYNWRIPK
jgi:hypothetical protein